jgi:hypothetical protein
MLIRRIEAVYRPRRPNTNGTEMRRAIPLSVKLKAALHALGLEPDSVEWHHEPALSLRPIVGDDTDPPANDPRHIIPMAKAEHRERTAKLDAKVIAKVRRISRAEAEFRERVLAKMTVGPSRKPSRWPSRPFPHRKNPS